MINLIIGKNSNLSKSLQQQINNVFLLFSVEVLKELKSLNLSQYKNINIVFNNFQSASSLNNLSNPSEYIYRTIQSTSDVLNFIKENNIQINKIIYTSSSSVYGNNILCSESDTLSPLNLHSSLKIANEKLIEKFCNDNKIDYTIARIFNMYGGNDKFSIISKIENAYINDEVLTIVNNGNAVRDFIHIDDVVRIYNKLLEVKEVPSINIGTGVGISIKNIIDFLYNNDIDIKTKTISKDELKISTADTIKLFSTIGKIDFQNVEEFLIKRLSGS